MNHIQGGFTSTESVEFFKMINLVLVIFWQIG